MILPHPVSKIAILIPFPSELGPKFLYNSYKFVSSLGIARDFLPMTSMSSVMTLILLFVALLDGDDDGE